MNSYSSVYNYNSNIFFEQPKIGQDEVYLCPQYLETNNVRVHPQKIVFENPFDGKQFEEKITISNCGEKVAFIRILKPTSSNILMKPIREGKDIPAGLSIVKKIKYVVSMATIVPAIFIPMYINNKVVNYRIEIKLSKIDFVVEPEIIDFGLIDAGTTVSKRKVKLTNNGGKTGRFSIDLGHNEFNIYVDPLRGVLEAKGFIMIDVELIVFDEGKFQTEFWIISENPKCVKICGDVVFGKIEAIHQFAMEKFTFIHFPCTYYGLKSILSLPIRNKSQVQSAFCVNGEVDLHTVSLDSDNPTFKHFDVQPLEGRLLPNDVRPFTLVFRPQKGVFNKHTKDEYIMAVIQITKLYCKDLNVSSYDEKVFYAPRRTSLPRDKVNESVQSLQSIRELHFMGNFSEESLEMPKLINMEEYFESTVRVMLYGVPEQASITVVPNELIFLDIKLKETERRILKLTNNSKNLPIYYQYKKIAFVEIVPKTGWLGLGESKEIEVLVTAQSYDIQESVIKFNLLYYDNSQLDNELKVVGSHAIPITIQQKIISKKFIEDITVDTFDFKKPFCKPKIMVLNILKKEQALLGLPNDRPGSLRVWKSTKICRTLYAGIPRYGNIKDDYELSYTKLNSIKNNKDYYKNFVKEQSEKIRLKVQLKNPGKLENYDVLSKETCMVPVKIKDASYKPKSFIPLTPYQLYNVKITPRNSVIHNVVPFSSFINTIKITNNNDVALRIFLRPQKHQSFDFFNGNRCVIKPKSSTDISYLCYSHNVGVQNYILDVIVNEDTIFETSIIVHVKHKMLKIEPPIINFNHGYPKFKFIEFINVYNSVVDFKWDYLGDFKVFPTEGTVLPGKSLICMLYYKSGNLTANNYELTVIMGNQRSVSLRVLLEISELKINIPDKLYLPNIASSIVKTQEVFFKNDNNFSLSFEVNTKESEEGFNVAPLTGEVPPKSLQRLAVEIYSDNFGDLTNEIEIKAGSTKQLMQITAVIQFPNLVFIPEVIRFRKIAASSYDCKTFTIKNVDKITAKISFDTERNSEISYLEFPSSKLVQTNNAFYIEPNKEKKFLIQLNPLNSIVTSFYIPIQVNNINIFEKIRSKSFEVKPPTKLYLAVLSHKLLIKSWKYNFNFFPYYKYKSIIYHNITISNPSQHNELTFCIRTDELKNPYSLNHIRGGNVVYHDFSIVVTLNPEEKIIFKALFNPDTPGFYDIQLPLFIKDDVVEEPHNYLSFKGEYFEPKLSLEQPCAYFGLLPLGLTIAISLKLNMEYHKPDCKINIVNSEKCLNVFINNFEPSINSSALMELEYSSDNLHLLDTVFVINCTCGVEIELPCYGCVVNCFLTIHACIKYFEIFKNETFTSLFIPEEIKKSKSIVSHSLLELCTKTLGKVKLFFYNSLAMYPESDSPFRKYMDEIVHTMENWMYKQGLFGKFFYKIPDAMVLYDITEERPDKDRAKHEKNILEKRIDLPITRLLMNLCGNLINKVVSNVINEEILFCIWLTDYYSGLKNFIISLGGLLPHIQPENLLDYENYKLYKSVTEDSPNIVSPERFYWMSKLVWLDFLVQIYKVFVYKRLLPSTLSRNASYLSWKVHPSFYSVEDKNLMSWLDENIRQQEGFLISSSENDVAKEIKDKRITNFEKDLSDGLAFIAVTVNYCPYFIKYFKSIFVLPISIEEHFHNACAVVRVWTMLRMSFSLAPFDIIDANPLKMVLFSAYLYDFMENIKPKETINLTENLSETIKENIQIINEGAEPIYYDIIFFENEEGVFQVNSNSIVIAPHKSKTLEVSYFAKFAKSYEAFMVLCGEIYGHKYSHSQSYILKGKPILKIPSSDTMVSSIPYVYKTYRFTVQSPYREKALYILYSCPNGTLPKLNSTLIRIEEVLKHLELSRVTSSQWQFETDEHGFGVLEGNICSVTNNTRDVWLLAKNETVGDFLIRFVVKTRPLKEFFKICLTFNAKFILNNCSCPNGIPNYQNSKCVRNINVPIPSRNELLWSSVMDRFLAKADECDIYFWSIYQGSTVGLHVLKRNLKDSRAYISEDMQYIFTENIIYNVKIKTNDVVGQKQITIINPGNVNETTNLKLHVNSHNINIIDIVLESVDKKETRLYKIYLNYESSRTIH